MSQKKKPLNSKSLLIIPFLLVSVLAIFLTVANIDNIQHLFGFASGKPANIVIDTMGVIGPMSNSWANFAQGGESKDYSFEPVMGQLSQLNPEYIRIDHIYDFYDPVSKNSANQLVYDWSKLDPILSQIQKTGATPFISLSYMPLSISSGDVIDAPISWHEWSQVVEQTITHISGKEGLNIPDVYYEVWNEPDLFGSWKTYGPKNYLTLYHQAALGSRRVKNAQDYKFGGPATTSLYKNWVTGFFAYIEKHQLPVDFYSWHLYSDQPEDFETSFQAYDQYMKDFPKYIFNVEPIITEWGLNSEIDPRYDTKFAAAHTVTISSLLFPKVSKAFSFEIQDGLDPAGDSHWGRWGMFTHADFGSQPKPRYTAHQWLSQLGGSMLSLSGEGSWVRGIASKTSSGDVITLVVNYDPYSKHVESFPITFKRLEPGEYILTQELLGAGTDQVEFEITTNSHTHSLTLAPNTVAKITLSKQ